jgi:hypothetical protein
MPNAVRYLLHPAECNEGSYVIGNEVRNSPGYSVNI